MPADDRTIRRATAADLPAINHIYYDDETRGVPDPPPYRALDCYAHILATGELFVAEHEGTAIGFSGRLLRGGVSFLTDLFVRPDAQSRGVGSALLRAAMPNDGTVRCTYASSDARALPLYTRAGMQPRYPQCMLLAPSEAIRPLAAPGVALVAADPGDPELLRWDAAIGGRERPQEFAYWFTACDALPFWLRRGERTTGYVVVQQHSEGAVWHPEASTIGALGVREREDAMDAVLAAVEWARTHAPLVRIFLPGPHPALGPLLEAGLRITSMDTFCCSADGPLFDPIRCVSTSNVF